MRCARRCEQSRLLCLGFQPSSLLAEENHKGSSAWLFRVPRP